MNILNLIRIIPFPTLPGWRHFYDIYFYAGWKIQRHEHKNQFRVISPSGKKWTKDNLEDCYKKIEDRKKRGLLSRNKHLVIIVPGLNNIKRTFLEIERGLIDRGYEVLYWEFGSNHSDTRGHAKRLSSLIGELQDIEKISFVAHSLGGLIVRTMLSEQNEWHGRFQLGRIVNIASPHSGSFVADLVRDQLKMVGLFDWVCGHVGEDLTSEGAKKLPPLIIPVGMIIGGSGNNLGFNPLAKQDNDIVVSKDSARIDLAVDSIQVKGSHTLMLLDKKTVRQTVYFLENGHFDHGE